MTGEGFESSNLLVEVHLAVDELLGGVGVLQARLHVGGVASLEAEDELAEGALVQDGAVERALAAGVLLRLREELSGGGGLARGRRSHRAGSVGDGRRGRPRRAVDVVSGTPRAETEEVSGARALERGAWEEGRRTVRGGRRGRPGGGSAARARAVAARARLVVVVALLALRHRRRPVARRYASTRVARPSVWRSAAAIKCATGATFRARAREDAEIELRRPTGILVKYVTSGILTVCSC